MGPSCMGHGYVWQEEVLPRVLNGWWVLVSSYLVFTASQLTSCAVADLHQPLRELRHCLLRWEGASEPPWGMFPAITSICKC